jgi:Abortive infection C-terminus
MSVTDPGRLSSVQVAKLVNRYIGLDGGYLGDFSYRTHADFYPEYCDLTVEPWPTEGTTRERFISILSSRSSGDQAAILRGVLQRFPVDQGSAPATRTTQLAEEVSSWASALESLAVPGYEPVATSDVVRRAIADAEALLKSTGATSAVDRVHTMLHGYLMNECRRANIAYIEDATNVALLKALRRDHPQLRAIGPRPHDVEKILNAFGSILDSMNPVRNKASVAHPNDNLLDETEAVLVINAARTVLGYLDSKLGRGTPAS